MKAKAASRSRNTVAARRRPATSAFHLRAQTITGATRLVALLGDPVAHSLSPAIHNHLFATLGLPYAYVPLSVKRQDLHAAIMGLRACGFAGANVTVPHKTAVIPCCDVLSDLAAAVGAVNTLFVRNGLLNGTTTDPDGFFAAMRAMDVDPRDRHIVVLGNGGTARTLSFALALLKRPKSLTLVGRDAGRVGSLASDVMRSTGMPVASTTFDNADLPATMRKCSLLVNCTSVGMHPNVTGTPVPGRLLHAGLAVFDTIYNPTPTRLVTEARRAGCPAENGLRMLLGQGLASFELWTGIRPAEDAVSAEMLLSLMESQEISRKDAKSAKNR